MTTHELKTDPEVFAAVQSGAKTHEIRRNDRGFEVGDELVLRETVHTGAQMASGAPLEYTGRTVTRTVSHIQNGYGLDPHWCILSFAASAEPLPTVASIVTDRRFMELLTAVTTAGTEATYQDAFQLLVRHLDGHNARHQQAIQTLLRLNEKLAELAASAPANQNSGAVSIMLTGTLRHPSSSQVDPRMALPSIPVKPTKSE